MIDSRVPTVTTFQLAARETRICEISGCRLRARKALVSVKDRRSQNRSGTTRHPIRKGTRQPQSTMLSGGKMEARVTPISAAQITATCWLAGCQAQEKPRGPGRGDL